MWRSLVDWILADTFAIGERPLAVASPQPRESEKDGVAPPDLLQSMASLLAEREALASLAKELESKTGDSEEMGRHIRNLLPVLDAMERVLDFGRECSPSAELNNWLKSVEGVYFRMLKTLERQGLEPLPTVGKPVDLNCQEVVEYIPSKEHGHDIVVSERQKGYRFRGKLVRDAKVVVAYNP